MPRYLPHAVWAAITLGLLLASGGLGWRAWSFHQRSVPAVGVIRSVAESWTPQTNERMYAGVVEWRDREGVARELELTAESAWTVGAEVALRYDPTDPDDVRRPGALAAAPVVLGLMGLVFLGILARVVLRELRVPSAPPGGR